MIKLVRVTVGC